MGLKGRPGARPKNIKDPGVPLRVNRLSFTDRIPEAGRLEVRGTCAAGARIDLSLVLWARVYGRR